MNDIYRRYFRIINGPLVLAVKEAMDTNEQARNEYSAILESVGANTKQWYHQKNRMVGIVFDADPDLSVFKKTKRCSGWWPKSNNKKGKEILSRLNAVQTKNEEECLKVVGLAGGFPSIFGSGRAYYPTITTIPSDDIVIFVSVPWYDEDPSVIEEYKKDRAALKHMNTNLDQLLWEPTSDMLPVKKWEFLKAIDEWNSAVRAAS